MGLTPFVNSNMIVGMISRNMGQRSDTEEQYQNNDSRNTYYEAQKRADMYMKLKDRKLMIFEYLQSKNPEKWVSVTMYINPDKMSIAQQKVKGKQYTRGGIFYHHWGDDHPVMSLSGTTGMSGMKGIEVLENIYHASGTLLRYQEFGPSKYITDTLRTQDNAVLLNDVNINSTVDVMNSAANSNSQKYISDLKTYVSKSYVLQTEWREYMENQRLIENSSSANSVMRNLQEENEQLRKQYYFPDGSGKDTTSAAESQQMVQAYISKWDVYLAIKAKVDQLYVELGGNPKPTAKRDAEIRAEIKDKHAEAISIRKKWKFDLNFEDGSYTYAELVNLKTRWIEAAKKYVQNKESWNNASTTVKDPSTGRTINLSEITKRNESLREKNGFPTGTYNELAKYVTQGKIGSENINLKINDVRQMTSTLLGTYQSVLRAQGTLDAINKVKDTLTSWVSSKSIRPTTDEYKNYALSEYRKIAGIDNSIITALAYQDAIYYSSDATEILNLTNSFANSSAATALSTMNNDSPIPYAEDVTAQLAAITADRMAALNSIMQEVAAYEEKEKKFAEELRTNALSDIMGDFTDEWKPRRIIIYYENRVYVGHFDQFSYSRDATNQLLIRYEMRITIEKQIIGSSL